MTADETELRDETFETFARDVGERVRRALVASFGVEIGTEAAADAMSVAWERWPALGQMSNPAGFLFRVGQSKARPHLRWRSRRQTFPTAEPLSATPSAANAGLIDLFAALRRLKPEERAAVLLVKSYGYSYREVAELLGTTEASVNNFIHRGLIRLRTTMEVSE